MWLISENCQNFVVVIVLTFLQDCNNKIKKLNHLLYNISYTEFLDMMSTAHFSQLFTDT